MMKTIPRKGFILFVVLIMISSLAVASYYYSAQQSQEISHGLIVLEFEDFNWVEGELEETNYSGEPIEMMPGQEFRGWIKTEGQIDLDYMLEIIEASDPTVTDSAFGDNISVNDVRVGSDASVLNLETDTTSFNSAVNTIEDTESAFTVSSMNELFGFETIDYEVTEEEYVYFDIDFEFDVNSEDIDAIIEDGTDMLDFQLELYVGPDEE